MQCAFDRDGTFLQFDGKPSDEVRAVLKANGFRWIPARSKVSVQYCAFIAPAEKIPESATWGGGHEIQSS